MINDIVEWLWGMGRWVQIRESEMERYFGAFGGLLVLEVLFRDPVWDLEGSGVHFFSSFESNETNFIDREKEHPTLYQ